MQMQAALSAVVLQSFAKSRVMPDPTTQPKGHYGVPSVEDVSYQLTNIRLRLERGMVMHVNNPATSQPLVWPATQPQSPVADEVAFESAGYPSGVAYAGMLAAGDATGDRAFIEFVARRFQFFADTVPLFGHQLNRRDPNPYRHWLAPGSLDSCGAMGAAFVKARRLGVGGDLQSQIDTFSDFVSHKQFRLNDGTLARQRPYANSIWADDMYMGVPFLAQLGALTGDAKYFDDAAAQVMQISSRLFVPANGLYTHGWHESIGDDQPHYFWARANGWCAMATVELLDVLPADHPKRADILRLLRAHARGIASVQSGQGMWHQMLDRPDSYLETSASAMFTFAIAHAVNKGWLDADTYAPVAIAGWNGVCSRIDVQGHVTGTCIGTSYAADYPYYYNRPVGDDLHGYGPTLLAGAEIIKLLKNPDLQIVRANNGPVMVK